MRRAELADRNMVTIPHPSKKTGSEEQPLLFVQKAQDRNRVSHWGHGGLEGGEACLDVLAYSHVRLNNSKRSAMMVTAVLNVLSFRLG